MVTNTPDPETIAVTRPALRYYGGKWKIAPWIISHFPAHDSYLEPCCGAASVLLQKPASFLETIGDIDSNVVNFFRVLRDQPDELILRIRLTPWAREEFEGSLERTGEEIEDARRFAIRSWMGIIGYTRFKNSWRSNKNPRGRWNPATKDLIDIEHLYNVAERIKHVQIENRSWDFLVQEYDGPGTLIYFDPPYPHETRTDKRVYSFEWSEEDHIKAAGLLRQAKGFVIVSGYACRLYCGLYEKHGWTRKDKKTQANSGSKRVESIWLSPRTRKALQW
jgi:DNA adenine methylase